MSMGILLLHPWIDFTQIRDCHLATLSCMVHRKDSSLKRPAKLKKTCVISDIYNDGYEMDFATLKSVKTDIIVYEEVASPSLRI